MAITAQSKMDGEIQDELQGAFRNSSCPEQEFIYRIPTWFRAAWRRAFINFSRGAHGQFMDTM